MLRPERNCLRKRPANFVGGRGQADWNRPRPFGRWYDEARVAHCHDHHLNMGRSPRFENGKLIWFDASVKVPAS